MIVEASGRTSFHWLHQTSVRAFQALHVKNTAIGFSGHWVQNEFKNGDTPNLKESKAETVGEKQTTQEALYPFPVLLSFKE